MSELRIGVALGSQGSDWSSFVEAGRFVDELGFDHLWTWDHLVGVLGDHRQPIFEGTTALAALAMATERVRLGLFVGANTFRNPGLAAKAIVTIDHISGGRAIMGLGAAWNEIEHRAYGLEFGRSVGQRLDWLGEAAAAVRTLLAGGTVTSQGGRYAFEELRLSPAPLQDRIQLMIGGTGERKTLPIVARSADMWNAFGSPETLARKDEILRRYCDDLGRDPALIRRTVGLKLVLRSSEAAARTALASIKEYNGLGSDEEGGEHPFVASTPTAIAAHLLAYRRVGFDELILEVPAPYDRETIESMATIVRPILSDAGR